MTSRTLEVLAYFPWESISISERARRDFMEDINLGSPDKGTTSGIVHEMLATPTRSIGEIPVEPITLSSAFGLGQREDFEPLKADEETDASRVKSSLPAQSL